ncbi:MAG TPA: FAD-dependent oxidoreductase [Gammaproteobacteria bacterium]|nr:FAD-dependent oxidoreductase [Gammaproteobacteria bacterium]
MSRSAELGTQHNPLRVAIIGSGPSGFYAAEALLKSAPAVSVDMFERLPAPFGLVRNGVAPDHPKLKEAIFVYAKIAEHPQFSFFGNVTIGHDVTVAELRASHHALVFCCGAETDRKLDIPGDELPGSHTATEFVGWYNGHPDYRNREFDLSSKVAVVIGQGNVAVDVCRILSKTIDELKHTDIAQHALDALADSKIREIHMIGRRGPAQAKFTHVEIRELGELADCDPVVNPDDLKLNPESEAELADKRNRSPIKNMEILSTFANRPAPTKRKRCYLRFLASPVELQGSDRVERLVLARNHLEGEPFKQIARETGEKIVLDCGLVFRSIGYRGVPMLGLPFDERRGVFSNRDGRVTEPDGSALPGLYCAGWIKRGPSGIIGTNRADSVATVKALLSDVERKSIDTTARPGADIIYPMLKARSVRVFGYPDWLKIDAAEIERGAPLGKPREKFTLIEEMLVALKMNRRFVDR